MKIHSNLIFGSAFLLLFLHATLISAQGVEEEREFDYIEGGPKGPSRWGTLKPQWAACKKGQMQSPIDISNRRVVVIPKLGELIRNYTPSNATIINRGYDITLSWAGNAGSVRISGTDYFLRQVHWHSPSEHTIDGRRYALELHMVHRSVNNKTAVVGLLYKLGQPDAFLSKLSRSIMSVDNTNETKNLGVIDPREIKMGGTKYYRYNGSLTTPPCTEGVIWIINHELANVSTQQVQLLRDAVADYARENARPLQPLNNREIQFYRPGLHQVISGSN